MKLHIASLLTALVGVGLYLNTLSHELVYDDIPAIRFNKDLRPEKSWSSLLTHDYWGGSLDNPISHKSYRPLCVATFKLNYLLHELEPMGYHLVNILLHGVVCYLYVQLCGLVLSGVWPALIAGLLFAVHPIHTEAVAGVVGRAELLCGVFYLLSILLYKHSVNKQGVRVGWFAASLTASVLALMSKEQGVTVLGVCLTLDFFVLHNIDILRLLKPTFATPPSSPTLKQFPVNSLKERANMRPFFVRGIAVGLVGLVAITTRILISDGTPKAMFRDRNINPPLFQEWPWRALSWLHLVFVNSWLSLNPSPLLADWRFGVVPLTQSLTDAHNILTLITLLSLAALTTFALSGRGGGARVTLFSLSLMVFPYLPASNLFFPVGFVVAERVLYLPSMGLCLLVAHGMWTLLNRLRTSRFLHSMTLAATLLLLVTHAAKTLRRNRDWGNNLELCESGLRVNPRNALLMNNAGLEYEIREEYSTAVSYYQAAMSLTPDYAGSYYNYGKLMSMARQYSKAEEALRTAVSLAETTGSEFNKIPNAYHLLIETLLPHPSRLHEAHNLVNHALSHHPRHTHLHTDKCLILDRLNRTKEAIQWCRDALSINPFSPRARYQLGVAYMRLGHSEESEQAFRDLLVLEPNNTLALFHLATLYQRRGGHMEEAAKFWHSVLHFEPYNVDALLGLAQVQDALSLTYDAVATINKILKLQPYHKQALYLGAQLLYRHGNLEEASRVLHRLYSIDRDYLDVEVMQTRINRELRAHPTG